MNQNYRELLDSLFQLVLEVFTWPFFENYCLARRLCANLIWNLIKLFIEKKTANDLPIETQCILPEERGKSQNHNYLILYPVVHLSMQHILTDLLSVYRYDV